MNISEANYQKVRQWLKQLCGVELGDKRHTLVVSRLSRRQRILNIPDINDYVLHLGKLDKTQLEWVYFVDLLTTHETYFFREGAHFDFLKQIVFPYFKTKPLCILSAACSTGEEVYSLAMECIEFFAAKDNWKIVGTDISEEVIKTAQQGVYAERRTKLIPQNYLKKYMLKGYDDAEGLCLVKPSLKSRVEFYVDNILEPQKTQRYDVIFCRNVLIYFDQATKQKLVDKLYSSLNPNGHLIVSQTEQLREFLPNEKLISSSIARKIE